MSSLVAQLVSDRDALRASLGREVQALDAALHAATQQLAVASRERFATERTLLLELAPLEQAAAARSVEARARAHIERQAREASDRLEAAERERRSLSVALAERREAEAARLAHTDDETTARQQETARVFDQARELAASLQQLQRQVALRPLVRDAAEAAVTIDVLLDELGDAERLAQAAGDRCALACRQCRSVESS